VKGSLVLNNDAVNDGVPKMEDPSSIALGVTIAICTYNGAARLPVTLEHLRVQIVPAERPWEVILIDNASTDNSSEIARRCWPHDSATQLRIVHEPQLGLSNARARAFSEAHYEVVSFVDDDNWVAPDWVETVALSMADPAIGGLNGLIDPVYEVEPPVWFANFRRWYAICGEEDLNQARREGALVGAGMTIRRSVWEDLRRGGFKFAAEGRCGSWLGGGEDIELFAAVRRLGWKLDINDRLRMQHFLPSERLNWKYVLRLAREGAASAVVLEAYHWAGKEPSPGIIGSLKQKWWWQFGRSLLALVKNHGISSLVTVRSRREGDPKAFVVQMHLGYLAGLLHLRSRFEAIQREVRTAPWWQMKSSGCVLPHDKGRHEALVEPH
jgi:cellulose synthase/poly-beta-1,6-N-acetylglucosamine synthase-like glycosyltransferase